MINSIVLYSSVSINKIVNEEVIGLLSNTSTFHLGRNSYIDKESNIEIEIHKNILKFHFFKNSDTKLKEIDELISDIDKKNVTLVKLYGDMNFFKNMTYLNSKAKLI